MVTVHAGTMVITRSAEAMATASRDLTETVLRDHTATTRSAGAMVTVSRDLTETVLTDHTATTIAEAMARADQEGISTTTVREEDRQDANLDSQQSVRLRVKTRASARCWPASR
jgi:hypothetical protein